MRPTHVVVPLVAALALLTGCVLAPYAASDGKKPGYVDRKLGPDRYELTVYGVDQRPDGAWAGRSRERQLRQNAFRRAEELCGSPLYTLDALRQGMAKRDDGKVAPTISATVTCTVER